MFNHRAGENGSVPCRVEEPLTIQDSHKEFTYRYFDSRSDVIRPVGWGSRRPSAGIKALGSRCWPGKGGGTSPTSRTSTRSRWRSPAASPPKPPEGLAEAPAQISAYACSAGLVGRGNQTLFPASRGPAILLNGIDIAHLAPRK